MDAAELHGIEAYPFSAKSIYYILEAIAFPAIHVFVLIGSYLMVRRTKPIKAVVHINTQTFIVTIVGLLVALVIIPSDNSVGGCFKACSLFHKEHTGLFPTILF